MRRILTQFREGLASQVLLEFGQPRLGETGVDPGCPREVLLLDDLSLPVDGREVALYTSVPVTVERALVEAGKPDASSVVIDAEIVHPEDYRDRVVPPTGLLTNQVPISKGNLRRCSLELTALKRMRAKRHERE